MEIKKPKIGMRVSKNHEVCNSCGRKKDEVLELFDIKIGDQVVCVCDECNKELLSKTLKANVMIDGRVRTKRDTQIINRRKNEKLLVEKANSDEKHLTINEALKGVKDDEKVR